MYYNEVTHLVIINNKDAIYDKVPSTFSFIHKTDDAFKFPAQYLGIVIGHLINTVPSKNRHMLYNIARLLIYQLKYQGNIEGIKEIESIFANHQLIHHLQDEMDPNNILSSPEWSENSPIAKPIEYDNAQPEKCLHSLLAILTDTVFEKSDKLELLVERANKSFFPRSTIQKTHCLSQLCRCFGLFDNKDETQPILTLSPSPAIKEDTSDQNCCSTCCSY